MRSFIVVGEKKAFLKYFYSFCEKKGIPLYERHMYSGVKIKDVREIKSKLVGKAQKSRVVVLQEPITIAAQNALLKSIEEVDEQTFFLINVVKKEDLLPTTLSRCTVVELERENFKKSEKLQDLICNWIRRPSCHNSFVLSEHMQNVGDGDFLRAASFLFYEIKDFDKKTLLYGFLKDYFTQIPLVKNNNLNVKLFWDITLLSSHQNDI